MKFKIQSPQLKIKNLGYSTILKLCNLSFYEIIINKDDKITTTYSLNGITKNYPNDFLINKEDIIGEIDENFNIKKYNFQPKILTPGDVIDVDNDIRLVMYNGMVVSLNNPQSTWIYGFDINKTPFEGMKYLGKMVIEQ
jgi:hypothetical protein